MRNLSLSRRFLIGSLVILLVGMSGIGYWVTGQIEKGVVHRTASTTAVYVDSLIAPSAQNLAAGNSISTDDQARLMWLLTSTPLGKQLALFRLWDRNGEVVFSSVAGQAGMPVELDEDFAPALEGKVSAHMGSIEQISGSTLTQPPGELIEIYSPVRKTGTDEVIGVAEFYFGAASLNDELRHAERRSWLVVGGVALGIYLLLAVFVQRASNTIDRQRSDLSEKVASLTDLLSQNAELNERVRGAATRTTAHHEQFLRRLSAELHDGPAQEMSLALLHIDNVQAALAGSQPATAATEHDLAAIKSSLVRALEDVRATSGGLVMPELETLTMAQVAETVVRSHRRRSGTRVDLTIDDSVPANGPLPAKIALYRIIQESLTNAWRHANGEGQRVVVRADGDRIIVSVSDQGGGFDPDDVDTAEHLGIVGMRERVESLGGKFSIVSGKNTGTTLLAEIPLRTDGAVADA
jgi:signal transduction histidine kinase